MDAHQLDIDHAKEQIHDTTQKADSYLTEMTKGVEKYEKNHSNFEPAGQYLKSALDASRAATQKLKTQGQDLSERSVSTAIDGMREVRESLDALQQQAVEYDDKYAGSRGQQAMDTLHHWVNVGRQLATDALESTNEQLVKLRDAIGNMTGQATHGAQVAVGEAVRAAEFGDEKLGVSTTAGGVAQYVKALDTRLGVTETAAKVDTTVTGGLGCKMAATTVDIVTEGVNYISETLYNTKLAAEQSKTTESVDAKGAAATEKTEEKAGEMKEKAGEMKDTAVEKAGEAKETAEDKAGIAKDKASEVKDTTAKQAGEAEEMANDKVEMAKDKAQDKAEMAKEKAAETADQAKGKSTDVKENTKEAAGQVKEKTEEKADESKEQSKGVMSHAADKVREMKDKAKRAAHIH